MRLRETDTWLTVIKRRKETVGEKTCMLCKRLWEDDGKREHEEIEDGKTKKQTGRISSIKAEREREE